MPNKTMKCHIGQHVSLIDGDIWSLQYYYPPPTLSTLQIIRVYDTRSLQLLGDLWIRPPDNGDYYVAALGRTAICERHVHVVDFTWLFFYILILSLFF